MAERIIFNALPDEKTRRAVCAWLKDLGIDPNDVPIPGWIERRNSSVAVQVYLRDADGQRFIDPVTEEAAVGVRVIQCDPPPWPSWPVRPM